MPEERRGFPEVGSVISIDPAFVLPMPDQPRKHFDLGDLRELANSIRVAGQKQPGAVKVAGKKGDQVLFRLKSGERRMRACKMLGILFRAEVVAEKSDAEEFVDAVVANFHGKDLLPLEMAEALVRIKKENGYTDEQLGALFGKSHAWATQFMSLLRLEKEVRRLMSPSVEETKRIKFWPAVRLVSFPPQKQISLARRMSREELSNTEALALIRRETSKIEERRGRPMTQRTPNRDYSVLVRFVTNMKSGSEMVLTLSSVRFREMLARRTLAEKRELLKNLRTSQESLHEIEEYILGSDSMLSTPDSRKNGSRKSSVSWLLGVTSGE